MAYSIKSLGSLEATQFVCIRKRSLHFELLANIMSISFDPLPASCLQQFEAWKKHAVRCQELSGEQLPDSIKLSAMVNGLSSSVRNFVLLHLESGCSFEDLDNLLAEYSSMHDRQVFSLTTPWDKACNDKQDTCKGKGHESNPHLKQQIGEGGNHQKRNGESNPPQPPAKEGKGKPDQLPKRKQWCSICWKKGHRTQACWWNTNQQHQQQHLQPQAWYNPSKQQHKTAAASKKRSQQVDTTTKPVTYCGLNLANHLASSLELESASLEHRTSFTQHPESKAPGTTIAMLESLQNASRTPEAWGILVDTGAATSVAPQSFASDIELSPAPSTFKITTATGKEAQIYGLRKVHLQSRGLSLKVNSVVADVLTPLLGLDTMIQNSLSLCLEHAWCPFLVNPAGERTQLEHIGKRLYMIACHSQHGLSSSLKGSLSQPIGVLPSDKELTSRV